MRLNATTAGATWLAAVGMSYLLSMQGAKLAAVVALVMPGLLLYWMARE